MLPMSDEGIAKLVPEGLILRIVTSVPSLTEVLNVGIKPMETVDVFVKETGTMRPEPVIVTVCEIPALDVPSSCTWLVAEPAGMVAMNCAVAPCFTSPLRSAEPATCSAEPAMREPETVCVPLILAFPELPFGSSTTVKLPKMRKLSAFVRASKGILLASLSRQLPRLQQRRV